MFFGSSITIVEWGEEGNEVVGFVVVGVLVVVVVVVLIPPNNHRERDYYSKNPSILNVLSYSD